MVVCGTVGPCIYKWWSVGNVMTTVRPSVVVHYATIGDLELVLWLIGFCCIDSGTASAHAGNYSISI